jgi:formylglycine-generating enzyme required for sulfatase activity
VLIVLDQFEQWLHSRRGEENTELVQALRQCDGGRLQCVVMVRDDFWLAVSRFMQALEIVPDGENSRLVDLFDPRHATKVLTAFGQAFGALPDHELTKDQHAFIEQVIAGFARDGKVVSVRLALFAEMVKDKPWTPTTLRQVGGTEGVGVAFLEATFAASTAPLTHRLHQKAAQGVLKALLPEAGTNIKGHMRSQQELLAASGYHDRPRDFGELFGILDGEVRLITPADPEGSGEEDGPQSGLPAGQRYYQLTHDYLVPSLREWLTRKQKETRRGRAELRLAERAALWSRTPADHSLPGWWEWAKIRFHTRRRDWTDTQRRMMRRAGRVHALRGARIGLALALVAFCGWWWFGALRASALVDKLLTANTAAVPEVVHDLHPYRFWADPQLRKMASQQDLDDDKRLRIDLALLPVDPDHQSDRVCDHLLNAHGPEEVQVIRRLLDAHARDSAVRSFWPVLQNEDESKSRRLRAACALALFAKDDPRWSTIDPRGSTLGDEVVLCLAGESLLLLKEWTELLKPVRRHLVRHQVEHLFQASAGSFAVFLTMLQADPEDALAPLHEQLNLSPSTDEPDKRERVRKQALAAVALLHLGRSEPVWPLFHQGEDPTCRTYLIHNCAELGVDPKLLADRLFGGEEKDSSVRQGLLLALGGYKDEQLAGVARQHLEKRVLRAYKDDPDPGVHSAAEWLLFCWGRQELLKPINDELIRFAQRDQAGLARRLAEVQEPQWYVNGRGQVFVVVPAPSKFAIGSTRDKTSSYNRLREQIDDSFAIGTKLVTAGDFATFGLNLPIRMGGSKHSPVSLTWYQAAEYCNMLSKKDGIPEEQWCYEPNGQGKYDEGMKVKANYQRLLGYRLPRAAEWEYACQAGVTTDWVHGQDEALLHYYAYYTLSIQPENTFYWTGDLKPNGLGLFDVHGLTDQWCQDTSPMTNLNENLEVTNKQLRSLRGGLGLAKPTALGPHMMMDKPEGSRTYFTGFRVAKTCR